MPTQRYALEPNGPKRLTLSWKGMYKTLQVALDGHVLGIIPDQKALRTGQSFPLPDGSAVHVQLVRAGMATELRVTRNGQPLPGSAADPQQKLKVAYGIVYFVGGLNVLLGVVALLIESRFLESLGIGWATIIFGAIMLGLGFMVQRRSVAALIAAIAIYAVDGVLSIVLIASSSQTPPVGGLIFRVIMIAAMYQGIAAIKALNKPQVPQF